jgi:hypothetical protein
MAGSQLSMPVSHYFSAWFFAYKDLQGCTYDVQVRLIKPFFLVAFMH